MEKCTIQNQAYRKGRARATILVFSYHLDLGRMTTMDKALSAEGCSRMAELDPQLRFDCPVVQIDHCRGRMLLLSHALDGPVLHSLYV